MHHLERCIFINMQEVNYLREFDYKETLINPLNP